MKVVLDHCMPRRFGALLTGHDARTARTLGFDGLVNGLLLNALQEFGRDALITVDQNLRFQQNLRQRTVSVVVLVAVNNRLPTLRPYAPSVLTALAGLQPGSLVLIHSDGSITSVK